MIQTSIVYDRRRQVIIRMSIDLPISNGPDSRPVRPIQGRDPCGSCIG